MLGSRVRAPGGARKEFRNELLFLYHPTTQPHAPPVMPSLSVMPDCDRASLLPLVSPTSPPVMPDLIGHLCGIPGQVGYDKWDAECYIQAEKPAKLCLSVRKIYVNLQFQPPSGTKSHKTLPVGPEKDRELYTSLHSMTAWY